ncbi:MAG: hypothetical protein IKB82_08255 [Clostridia bacterium]|nr:hypothetical protein [Clostridia bacterium]
MSEISKYEAQKKKLQGLCDEHELIFRFRKDVYPISLTIRPAQGLDAQLSMMEDVEEVGFRSPDSAMTWIFEDGVLTTKVTGGTFTISKELRSKIENILAKMISYWQQYFFRDVMEKASLRQGMMPVIDEDEADDLPDGAEPLEEFEDEGELPEIEDGEEDEETGSLDAEDPDIIEATRIVRMENKATTGLLQRRMNIGYAKAGRILEALEELGVVGPFNGSEPREVLAYDLPDDEEGGAENE